MSFDTKSHDSYSPPPPSYSAGPDGYPTTLEKPIIQDTTRAPYNGAHAPLEINWDKWTQGSMTISENNQPVYHVKVKYWQYKLLFSSQTQELAVGNISMYKHSFDIEYPDHSFKVSSDKFWKIQRSYDSPAFGQKITWKSQSGWKCMDFICSDDSGKVLARFKGNCGRKWKKTGTIEFAEGVDVSQAQKDEIVFVGVSLAWQIMQCMTSSVATSVVVTS